MKKILFVLLILVLCLNSVVCIAATEFEEMYSSAEQNSTFDMSKAIKEKSFITDLVYPENIREDTRISWKWLIIPTSDIDMYYAALFNDGKIDSAVVNNFNQYIYYNGMDKFSYDKAAEYADANGLSEPEECRCFVYSTKGGFTGYDIICDGIRYYIPYYFPEESMYNITEDEYCNLEIGKAYPEKKFKDILNRELDNYQGYIDKQEEERSGSSTYIYERNGETVYVLNGKEVSADEFDAATKEDTSAPEDNKKDEAVMESEDNKAEPDNDKNIKDEEIIPDKESVENKDSNEKNNDESDEDNKTPDIKPDKDDKDSVPVINYDTLKQWEIMVGDENGNLNLNSDVTRAEMAQFIVNILGLKKNIPEVHDSEIFTDVPREHWAFNAVYTCMKSGIICGNGDGTFAPDNNVRHEEVIKMLVSALGYASRAESNGAYPDGYIMIAEEIGLYDNFNFASPIYAKRIDIANLIIKSLKLPLMKSSDADKSFSIMDGNNGNTFECLAHNFINK